MKTNQSEEMGCAFMILAVGISIALIIFAVSYLPYDVIINALKP